MSNYKLLKKVSHHEIRINRPNLYCAGPRHVQQ
jgi:hypothetical protein